MDVLNFAELFTVVAFAVIGLTIALWRRRMVSSDNTIVHGLGMSLKWKDLLILLGVLLFVFLIKRNIHDSEMIEVLYVPAIVCSYIIYLLYVFKRFVLVSTLDNRRKDSYNHLLQTAILVCIGIFIVYIILHFNINDKTFFPFSFFAAVLGLVFNDSIKGVVAYYHLRSNNLLHIGDWIEVPSQGIDGVVIEITLVTVSVKNWDNTVSNVSIVSLQNGAFKNNQCVVDENTTGRLMDCSFIIDTSSIKNLDKDDIEKLKRLFTEIGEDPVIFSHYEGSSYMEMNIHLFRRYLSHWLMNNPEVTRYPRLIIRLKEPVPDGVPLQILTFILKTGYVQFEIVRSSIIEHVIYSMGWFGLQLYQKPSLEDIAHVYDD